MQTIALSKNAVAVLRLRVKGLTMPDNEHRLGAYRELADAGIMTPVPGDDGTTEADFESPRRDGRGERRFFTMRRNNSWSGLSSRDGLHPC